MINSNSINSSSLSVNRFCATLLAISASEIFNSLVPIEGKAFEDGFSYDFLVKERSDESLLPLIMKQMQKHMAQGISFEMLTMTPKNAQSFLHERQPIQAAMLETVDSTVVQLCKMGSFYDICSQEMEPDIEINEYILYEWIPLDLVYPELGDVSIVRIRGAAFEDKKSIKRFLKQFEMAKKNNPLQLVEEYDLASWYEGKLLWHPRGAAICAEIESAWKRECIKRGFEFIDTPHDAKKAYLSIFQRYSEQGKPLPYRFAEFHQKEMKNLSKESDGLFVTQDCRSDSLQVLCSPEQVDKEIISSLQFMQEVVRMLGLECHFVLRYSKTKGVESVIKAFSELGISFEKRKDFITQSGPKIELYATDLRGRKWSISTVWIDYELSRKIKRQPEAILLCQSMFLSLERIIALLLEKNGGDLPFWMAPEQIRIFLVDSVCAEWAKEIKDSFCLEGIRAKIDTLETSLATKIYEASQQKIPVGIVMGERELKNRVLNVRFLQEWQQSIEIDFDTCVKAMKKSNQSFALNFDIKRVKNIESESRDSSS